VTVRRPIPQLMLEELEALFHRNFDERDELGASVSVWRDGREIAAFHHGWRDREHTEAWTDDTVVPVWSATKGPAAVATLLALHEAGLSPASPVADLWPELRAARDGRLTFAGLLSHQSGLPALSPDNRPAILAYREVVAALEAQKPHWEPGRAHGYHPRTLGFLLDETVRRATGGTSLGDYWNERIAGPLKLDFHIGDLAGGAVERLATVHPPRLQRPSEAEKPFFRALGDPDSLSVAAFSSPAGLRALSDINKLEYLQAGLPALGGVGTASGLAKFYQVLAGAGRLDGQAVLPATVVDWATRPQSDGDDRTLLLPTSFTCGFMRDPLDGGGDKLRTIFGPSVRAFGQPGAGGSHAFADPEHGLSFAYVMNRMETGILPNRKSLDLVEAMYR